MDLKLHSTRRTSSIAARRAPWDDQKPSSREVRMPHCKSVHSARSLILVANHLDPIAAQCNAYSYVRSRSLNPASSTVLYVSPSTSFRCVSRIASVELHTLVNAAVLDIGPAHPPQSRPRPLAGANRGENAVKSGQKFYCIVASRTFLASMSAAAHATKGNRC